MLAPEESWDASVIEEFFMKSKPNSNKSGRSTSTKISAHERVVEILSDFACANEIV